MDKDFPRVYNVRKIITVVNELIGRKSIGEMLHNGIKILMLHTLYDVHDIVEGLMDAPNALSLSLKRLHREHIHANCKSLLYVGFKFCIVRL